MGFCPAKKVNVMQFEQICRCKFKILKGAVAPPPTPMLAYGPGRAYRAGQDLAMAMEIGLYLIRIASWMM